MAVAPAKRAKGFFLYWLPLFLWMGFIFYVSSLPGEDIPPLFAYQDILYHGISYGILAWFFSRALAYQRQPLKFIQAVIIASAFGCLYGITDEMYQLFVPGRSASVGDVAIDALGSLLGSIFYRWQLLGLCRAFAIIRKK